MVAGVRLDQCAAVENSIRIVRDWFFHSFDGAGEDASDGDAESFKCSMVRIAGAEFVTVRVLVYFHGEFMVMVWVSG